MGFLGDPSYQLDFQGIRQLKAEFYRRIADLLGDHEFSSS